MDWIKLFDTDLAIKHYCKAPFSMRKRGFKERVDVTLKELFLPYGLVLKLNSPNRNS